ncbi:MAG: 5-formyltetrahydrofolate cyclo-ligase [Actinomycetota bacterium]|nr:5-formyltetrahydrofolate cyclo-ligase [Actinomycetota bacterium]
MEETKSQVRSAILAARRLLDAVRRDQEATDLARHAATLAVPGSTVCAYVPVGSEPGSLAMVDALAAHDVAVLLPVARNGPDDTPGPLQWGRYRRGELVAAPFGLREPPPPTLPPETVGQAGVVLVPALAVDRRGVRLGRGAGFYDRTLGLAAPGTLLVAVVRDDELVERLPAEPHDVAMSHALTPGRGLVRLGE